jgi:uncharacterized protein (DUF924 family)
LTARYLSKKALKLTDAEKTQTFENFVQGRSRQNLTETCLGHLGPSLNHPRSWFSLTILFDGFKRTVWHRKKSGKSRICYAKEEFELEIVSYQSTQKRQQKLFTRPHEKN